MNRVALATIIAFALLFGLVVVLEGEGQGLSLEEVFELKQLGFTDSEIVVEIQRTGTRLQLNATDREGMRVAGFGDSVFEALAGQSVPAKAAGTQQGSGSSAPSELLSVVNEQDAPPRQVPSHSSRAGQSARVAETPKPAPTTPQSVPKLPVEDMVIAAYAAPAAVTAQAVTLTNLAVEAAFCASRATGGARLVTHGTLQQVAAGTLEFRYTATPTDRIHVRMTDGTTTDYYFSAMQGQLQKSATNFLTNDHSLLVRVVSRELDLQLTSKKTRPSSISYESQHEVALAGSFHHAGKPATIDLRGTGTAYFETSFAGFESRTNMRYTGQMRAGGIDFALAETWEHINISATGRRPGRIATTTQSSSSNVRTIRTRWSVSGQSFQFRDWSSGLLSRMGPHPETTRDSGRPAVTSSKTGLRGVGR